MTTPPYNILKLWIELHEADDCDKSYFYAADMMEKNCGSIEEAYGLCNWYSTHIVMGLQPEELRVLANNYK